jgi:hypothetical protein
VVRVDRAVVVLRWVAVAAVREAVAVHLRAAEAAAVR